MKTYKYLAAGLCSMFMFSSCLDEYVDLNTNPEVMGTADPVNVFAGATKNYNNCSRGHLTGLYSGTMRYMQYIVSDGGPSNIYIKMSDDASRPSPSNLAYSYYYSTFGLYLDNLINTTIANHETPEKYNDIKAIAQILLNHQQWSVLDCLGAAPITEAFKNNEGIKTPRYDLYQESVREDKKPMYKVIDEEVKAAVALLKQSGSDQVSLGNADFFYNGDVQKWIKFGNTLRVKMAQRVEKRDAAFYESVISEVLTSASNVIDSNEASCLYWHPNDYNNNLDDIQDITGRYVASAAFVNFLKTYNDPRLPLLVRPNGFGLNNNNESNDKWFETFKKEYPDYESTYPQFLDRYSGMSANPDSVESKFHRSENLTVEYTTEEGGKAMMDIRMHSQVEGRFFVKNGGDNGNSNMPARDIEDAKYEYNQDELKTFNPIITYPETCFMIAEIAVKKGQAVAGKDATAWMKEGIKASMEQYKSWAITCKVSAEEPATDTYNPLTAEKIAAYLAQPEFQEATLEKIISQQWINLFRQPQEMWATWKRTGLPAFKATPEPENGVAFLEEIRDSEETLIIPRRNGLGTPNTLNIENYNTVVKQLISDQYYGTAIDRTEGRIWWDVNDL